MGDAAATDPYPYLLFLILLWITIFVPERAARFHPSRECARIRVAQITVSLFRFAVALTIVTEGVETKKTTKK